MQMLFGDKCAKEEKNMEMCLFTRPVLLFNSDIFTFTYCLNLKPVKNLSILLI